MQTKRQSIIEIITSTAIGYVVSLISLYIIFPIFGIVSSTTDNLLITLYFTVISLARGFVVRRYFNKKNNNQDETYLERRKAKDKITKGCICDTGVSGFCMEHKTDWV